MFRFANIEILWLLVCVPVFIAAYVWFCRRQRRRLREFGDPELVAQLMPNASRIRPHIKFTLQLLAFIMLTLACARPQYGTKEEVVTREGVEAMIALDISNSMLAEDIQPSRLTVAKQMLSQLIDKMSDDKVGLVVFAGDAFVQLPITCDYVSAKMFLQSIQPDLIQTQGTAIGKALETSIRAFGNKEDAVGRAIIIITDGENHEDDAVKMAERAKKLGIRVIVVGIGSTEGAPIPMPGTTDFKRDREGEVVVTALNEEMCQQIAQAGGGIYVHCDNTNTALRTISKELERLGKEQLDTHIFSEYNEQYPSFVLIALLLLVVDFFVFNRKNKSISRMNLFGEKKTMIVLLIMTLSLPTWAQEEYSDIRRGNKAYQNEQWAEAETCYRRAIDKNPNSYEATYNLGNALIRQDKPDEAEKQYERAISMVDKQKEPEKMARLYHNLGNSQYLQQHWDQAIESYKKSLRLNPKDNDTRYNLVKAMQQKQKQEQNQNQNQNQQPQQQEKPRMDENTAEQLLQALEQDEQKTQEKTQKRQGKTKDIEKDW